MYMCFCNTADATRNCLAFRQQAVITDGVMSGRPGSADWTNLFDGNVLNTANPAHSAQSGETEFPYMQVKLDAAYQDVSCLLFLMPLLAACNCAWHVATEPGRHAGALIFGASCMQISMLSLWAGAWDSGPGQSYYGRDLQIWISETSTHAAGYMCIEGLHTVQWTETLVWCDGHNGTVAAQ